MQKGKGNMERFIRRFVNKLYGKNKIIFFVSIAIICILSLCVGIYAEYFYQYAEIDPLMMGINIGVKRTQEEYDALKANFNSLFTNELYANIENVNVEKKQETKEVVYTNYDISNQEDGKYNINVKLPIININEDVANSINSKIKIDFYDKISDIMNNSKEYTIYNTSYVAYINKDILSIAIKSSIKEGSQSERIRIKTYNYSILAKKEVSLEDLIELKETTKKDVQKIIKEEIKVAYNNAKDLQSMGYPIYQRDLNNSMYNVENTNEYFVTQDGYVYVVYSYGNNAYTNEVDVVIF